MSVWTWVLLGLCVAGALLAVFGVVAVLLQALRIRARVNELRNSRLFASMESLQMQSARLSRLSAQTQPLAARARNAVGEIRTAAAESGLQAARESLQEAGAQIDALREDLR